MLPRDVATGVSGAEGPLWLAVRPSGPCSVRHSEAFGHHPPEAWLWAPLAAPEGRQVLVRQRASCVSSRTGKPLNASCKS